MGCNVAMVGTMWYLSDVHGDNVRSSPDSPKPSSSLNLRRLTGAQSPKAYGATDYSSEGSKPLYPHTLATTDAMVSQSGRTAPDTLLPTVAKAEAGAERGTVAARHTDGPSEDEFFSCHSSDDLDFNREDDDEEVPEVVSSDGSASARSSDRYFDVEIGSEALPRRAKGPKSQSAVSNTSSHPSSIHHVCKMVF